MTDRSAIESALFELETLLADDEVVESDFQTWFESHDVIFDAYGYRRRIAHPEIVADGKTYVPDFIAERIDGLWEIVELKRPDTKVLKDRERRQTFYASLEEYYAQCRDYSRALESATVRENLNLRYDCEIQRDVQAVIVAGRRAHVDLRQVHSLLHDRGSKASLQTYDEIRSMLEFHRTRLFARNENLPGISVHLLINPGKVSHRPNYIIDLGVQTDRDRISFYIDDQDHICFRVIDSSGTPYLTRVSMLDARMAYGEPVYLAFELGLAQDYSFACIETNGVVFVDRRLDNFNLNLDALKYMVVGSDVRGRAHTEMRMCTQLIFSETLPFSAKVALRQSIFQQYFAEAERPLPAAHYSGHQFMYSTDHPNFQGRSA
jgi:hypothetical protein